MRKNYARKRVEGKKSFVAAEIPPLDIAERPCFRTARGRIKGSYIRVGDGDKPMTEYEVYSFEAFRKNIEDDIRVLENVEFSFLDKTKVISFLNQRKEQRQNLALLDDKHLMELNGITRAEKSHWRRQSYLEFILKSCFHSLA